MPVRVYEQYSVPLYYIIYPCVIVKCSGPKQVINMQNSKVYTVVYSTVYAT